MKNTTLSEAYFKASDALDFASIYIPPYKFKVVEITHENGITEHYIPKSEFSNILEPPLFKKMSSEVISHLFDVKTITVRPFRTEKEIERYHEMMSEMKETMDKDNY